MQKLILRGSVAAGAMISALAWSAACAQEALPTIEIGRTKPMTAHAGRAAPAQRPAATITASTPAEAGSDETGPLTQPKAPDTASSVRKFTGAQVNAIPFAQPAEALQIVPGLIVAQHSGSGKANQYFLRGFALDHSNDIALWLDGMPLNMPSFVHGQGYADANFIIPELFSSIDVRKGPYFADEGAFASAGAVHMQYVDKLRQGLFSASGGSFFWGRLLSAKSYAVGDGELLSALELGTYNGPWEYPETVRKINSFMRWTQGTQENGLSLTGMAYSNHWMATDQVPQRAVNQGLLSRWGNESPSDGGNAARYSLSARWSQTDNDSASRVEGYIIRNTANLSDNTTYYLRDPILGDQVHQFDRRTVFGLNAVHAINYHLADIPVETRVGLQGRYDDIRNGFGDSVHRAFTDVVRDDYIKEGSVSLWTDTTVRWSPWFRTTVGGRFDFWSADVRSIQTPFSSPRLYDEATGALSGFAWTGPFNSGSKSMTMGSPKAGLVLGPFNNTEFFLNFGEGLQSSDARGTVQTLDIRNGTPFGESGMIQPVPFLVKTRGAEAGVRTKTLLEGLDTSLSVFWQDFDAENLFAGDEGTTVFGRPSRRWGFELTNRYSPTSWAHFDGVVSATHARFRGNDYVQAASYMLAFGDPLFPASLPGNSPGNYLTNAPTVVATGGFEIGEKSRVVQRPALSLFWPTPFDRGRTNQIRRRWHAERTSGLSFRQWMESPARRFQHHEQPRRHDRLWLRILRKIGFSVFRPPWRVHRLYGSAFQTRRSTRRSLNRGRTARLRRAIQSPALLKAGVRLRELACARRALAKEESGLRMRITLLA
jgi:hypothetical protein